MGEHKMEATGSTKAIFGAQVLMEPTVFRKRCTEHAEVPFAMAVYARTATDDGFGTECKSQVRDLLGVLDPSVTPVVYTDAGQSGNSAGREGLRSLLMSVQLGRVQVVLVRDIARLARDPLLLNAILKKFEAAGVAMVILSDWEEEMER